MSDSIKHAKVTTTEPQEDGSLLITTESFYDRLAHRTKEIENHVPVSKRDILSALVDCLDVITKDGAPELTITIKTKDGEPKLLTKRWVVSREAFDKR